MRLRAAWSERALCAREPKSAVSPIAATTRDGGCRLLRVALRRGARRCSGRASDPSRSPLCAASARGECALCLHVRVRALAAIMCMMCIACQTLPSIGSPFSFTACLCRRDDSTWSMTRWAPSEAARLFIVRSTSYGIYLHMTVHGLRRSCSGVFVIVIACLSPPPPSPPPPMCRIPSGLTTLSCLAMPAREGEWKSGRRRGRHVRRNVRDGATSLRPLKRSVLRKKGEARYEIFEPS